MIDLKQLRIDPELFRKGANDKGIDVDIDRLLELDAARRGLLSEQEARRAEQKKLSKELGPQLGELKRQLQTTEGSDRRALEKKISEIEGRFTALKSAAQGLDRQAADVDCEWRRLWLTIPQPPDPDVPRGKTPADNVELRRWSPASFDPRKPFADNRGFAPRTHLQLVRDLQLVDFERGVKMSGTRHYVLKGDGMRLHQAILRFGLDAIINEQGFTPITAPVVVREECMLGTGFFPSGRDQAYHIAESTRGAGHDLFLIGTGEVSLMALHADEILDAQDLPLRYATVSTCFRREAGAAGIQTAGLYRIHQFDKVEQVVICRADEADSRRWHTEMIGIVETLLKRLGLPYRIVECCTGDLGPKNAGMFDIECWMPGRGPLGDDGHPQGAFGETHSASRLYDYQCRRLNIRYRDETAGGRTAFCHSLNNTVIASPRILIPILEVYQNADGSITVPEVLRPYMNGKERIG